MSKVEAPQVSQIEVLALGLDSPRKLSFGSDRALYVAEAGRGGTGFSIPSPSVPDAFLTISADGDLADVYYPVVPNLTADQLPIALMLQGALMDKSDYSNYAAEVANYAAEVASYGFVVVVPNNEQSLIEPPESPEPLLTGLLADEQQVNDVLAQMMEDADTNSSIFEIVDTSKLVVSQR